MSQQTKSQRWTDASGRQWIAKIDIGDAERLRTIGLDVLNPKAIGNVFADPFKVVELIVAVHEKQWTAQNLTDGDFAAIATETEEVANAAADALEVALADFFRRLRRPALAAVVERAGDAARKTQAAATAKVNSPRAIAAIEAEANKALAKLDEEIERRTTGETSGA